MYCDVMVSEPWPLLAAAAADSWLQTISGHHKGQQQGPAIAKAREALSATYGRDRINSTHLLPVDALQSFAELHVWVVLGLLAHQCESAAVNGASRRQHHVAAVLQVCIGA